MTAHIQLFKTYEYINKGFPNKFCFGRLSPKIERCSKVVFRDLLNIQEAPNLKVRHFPNKNHHP